MNHPLLRRAFAAFLVAAPLLSAQAQAQAPAPATPLDAPLHIVVGYAPGGATDRVASDAREGFYRTVLKAVDDEAAGTASAPAKP